MKKVVRSVKFTLYILSIVLPVLDAIRGIIKEIMEKSQ